MTDLPQLLDRAAGVDPEPAVLTAAIHADLGRGRRTLARTRRRRSALGLAGVAAAGVVGVGVVRFAPGHHPATVAHQKQTPSVHQSNGVVNAVALLDQPLQAGPYSFATTPAGWAVQGVNSTAVTIVPTDGSTDDDPNSYTGKLVILFDGEPVGGQQVTADGRTFWITSDSGYTTISTRTLPGEQAGVVRVQFPDNTGWSQDTMLAFLASVRVGPGAQQGVG